MSKTLSGSQRRYPAHLLEFLALKWSVCEKLSHWLKGHSFTAWTDNNPLTYIMTKPRLDACKQRWVAELSPYTFTLKHIPGPKNIVAGALSRDPFAKSVSHMRAYWQRLREQKRMSFAGCFLLQGPVSTGMLCDHRPSPGQTIWLSRFC